MFLAFGEWLPDQPPLKNPGVLSATNVVAGANATYESFPSLNLAATGPMGAVSGVYAARDNADNSYVYCGDGTALYRLAGQSFTAATRVSGGAYATGDIDAWEFVQWGQTVVGVNGLQNVPQTISLGATNFSNLTGAPPARHIGIINNFMVLGNISDSATGVQRVRWSGLNNNTDWSLSTTGNLADYQDILGNGGWVQKIVSGSNYGFIFLEREIWMMQFVGSPLIFQFQKMVDGCGALAPQSVILWEGHVYFLADDGFKIFDGNGVTPIGAGKIDESFFDDLDTNYTYRVQAMVIPERKLICWAYPGSGNTNGNPNHVLCYNWAFQKWTRLDGLASSVGMGATGLNAIGTVTTPGYTLDGLNAVSSSLDALMYSLDSKYWVGGDLLEAAFIGGNLYYMNGTALTATITTTELNPNGASPMFGYQNANAYVNHKAQVNTIWPVADYNSASIGIVVSYRNTQQEPPQQSPTLVVNSTGYAPSRVLGRYFRFSVTIGGDWNSMQGVDVEFWDCGVR